MPIFSIFAFGTGESSKSPKSRRNMISMFSEKCTSPKLILDGPATKLGDPTGAKKIRENVQTAINGIKDFIATNESDAEGNYVINFAGYSRGALTGRRMTNELEEQVLEGNLELIDNKGKPVSLNKLKINLFELDPVAGLSDKGDIKVRRIPNIVSNHVAVLQQHEMRRDFKPGDRSRTTIVDLEKTNSVFVPVYGNHSDGVKVKNDKMMDVPAINSSLLFGFLTKHGTEFKNEKGLDEEPALWGAVKKGYGAISQGENTPQKLLERFASAKENQKVYEASGKKFKLGFEGVPLLAKIRRSFNDHLENYVTDSYFFMNQYERELFKQVYPKLFNHLFEHGTIQPKTAEISKELETMRTDNPKLFQSLEKIGVAYDLKTGKLTPRASGRYLTDLSPLTTDIDRKSDTYKRYLLELQINQLTFNYQRNKPGYMVFFNRMHHELADEIRNDIHRLPSKLNATSTIIYQKSLDKLENHYMKLIKSGSTSDLVVGLEKILKEHGREYHYSESEKIGPALMAGVGGSISDIGKVIKGIGNGLGTVSGFFGTPIEDFGRRLNDFGIRGLGDFIEGSGYLIKIFIGFPAFLTNIGNEIISGGNQLKRNSDYYKVEKQPEITKADQESVSGADILSDLGVTKKAAQNSLHEQHDEETKQKRTSEIAPETIFKKEKAKEELDTQPQSREEQDDTTKPKMP